MEPRNPYSSRVAFWCREGRPQRCTVRAWCIAPAGVVEQGIRSEGSPGTWESLTFPRASVVVAGKGGPELAARGAGSQRRLVVPGRRGTSPMGPAGGKETPE
jgi:hypothetical protein